LAAAGNDVRPVAIATRELVLNVLLDAGESTSQEGGTGADPECAGT